MAKKKKSVLEYDPLAWLNEAENQAEKAQTVVLAQEVVEPVASTDDSQPFGFFAQEAETNTQETLENNDQFGFFADDDNDSDRVTADDEGSQFGFFADEPEKTMNDDDDNNVGFGLFADEDDADALKTLDISKGDAINIGSELTIKTVSDIKLTLLNKLTADQDIIINAEEMIKIDTAGLQLLHSLKDTLNQTGHHIKWVGTSSVINDSAEMIGMPVLAPKSKDACFGFFEENAKNAEDGSSGFF